MKTAMCCYMTLIFAALTFAQDFQFEIASPVAAQDFRFKSAPFVFRTSGCADPGRAVVTAKAEGLVDGARQSMALKVMPSSKPGVYGVLPQWSSGRWAVILQGTCGQTQAGAIIPVGATGFVRDASKFLTHPATPTEIETALKAFPQGGYK
jgi:hypothetical protein